MKYDLLLCLTALSGISVSIQASDAFSDKVGKMPVERHAVLYTDKDNPVQNHAVRDTFNLDEVVVTGQGGAIQRRRLSSNVSKVSPADLLAVPSTRMDQMLQNAIPNVQFALTGGQPGTTSIIKSRGLSSAFGNSTPVIYVDGIRMDNLNTGAALGSSGGATIEPYSASEIPMGNAAASGSLSDIPMENIDHIEYVPGGAATTLYGSDAANGVIQIFTKKGGGNRFHATVSGQWGLDVANSQFYHFKRTKDLLHQAGFNQTYRIGFDGGDDRFGYSFGGSMSHDYGMLVHNGNENKKYDMRFGSHARINSMLEYQNSFGFVMGKYHRTRNGNQGLYTGLWSTECGSAAMLSYVDAQGNRVPFNSDIDAMGDDEYSKFKQLVDRAEELQNHEENVKRFQTSQIMLFNPLPNLTFKGLFGIDYRYSQSKNIVTREYLVLTQTKTEEGRILNNDRNYFGLTTDINGQYKYYHNDWFSSITTAGFQLFTTNDHQSAYNGINVSDGMQVMSNAATVTANEWQSKMSSYGVYLQDNLGFLNRYYLDFGMRVDYNSAFGDNVGWQFYPKIGLSYILSDEAFMRPAVQSGIVNTIRLLANYGVAGNYPPPYEYQRTINVQSYLGNQAGVFDKKGNPDLGPEKKHSYEIGLDAALLRNRLNVGFTYYYTRTKGAIFSVPTLPSSGETSTYLANVGDIRNKGIELSIAGTPIKTHDWTLNLHGSLNTNANKVLSTGGLIPFGINGFEPDKIQVSVSEGLPVGYLRGNRAVLNADGTLKEVLTLQNLGNTLPKAYGNFGLNLSFRQWRFSASGDYQWGSSVLDFNRQFRFMWTGKDPRIPEAALTGSYKPRWSELTNFFIDKADFLKIRQMGVDYTFVFRHSSVNRIDLAFNVYNPFSFTASDIDPEAVLPGALSQGAVATSGIAYATYSLPRQYVMTVTLNF